jgi:predicted nucleic acid-binding protein/tetrahydromethanopterin S-methyltransferase subunit G
LSLKNYDLKTLERLSAFILNRTTYDLRSELHEYLVMMALEENKEGKGMTASAITASVERDLDVEKFPYSLIESTVQILRSKGAVESVHSQSGEIYLLSQDKRNKIEVMKEQYDKTLAMVKQKLGKKVGKIAGISVDMALEMLIFASFRNFLSTILSNLGAQCCFAIVGSHGKKPIAISTPDIIQSLQDVLSTTKDPNLRDAEKRAFIEYITNPDEDLSDYIYSLAQSYFIIQVLHLDPECQSCTRESLRRKKVYLDTNVIVHSLTDTRKEAVNKALELSKELEIGIVFSKRTKQEFSKLIEDAKKSVGKDPKVPNDRFKKLQNELDDGFLKDFLIKKYENPNLTFDRYADRLKEVEAILRNRYSATYDGNTYEEILKHPDLSDLEQIVVEEGMKFGLFKNESVAEHDAYHILLIQELRKKEAEDILGPSYWFLTHDRSLNFVEAKFGKYDKFPSSVFVDNWVQLISPLIAPEQAKNARDAYISLFASRLPNLAATIDDDVFLAYQGKWMDDEDLTPQDIARVIGNRYIEDHFKEVRKEGNKVTEEERDMIIQPVIEEIKSQKRETKKLKQEIASLKQDTVQLETKARMWEETATQFQTKAGNLEKTAHRQKSILDRLGLVIGALVFLVLWFVLFQYILIQRMDAWQAFLASLVVSTIFGYLAGFPGYRKVLDRILRSPAS